jgi:hypothetical protein
MSLDAIHFVFQNKIASEEAIRSFRKFNPESKYVVICDGGSDYSDVCFRNGCEYLHFEQNLGYPHPIYGHRKSNILEYLKRVHDAVSLCAASHIITMEDDVRIISGIEVKDSDEMLVTKNGLNNRIHPDVIRIISENSDVDGLRDNYYALGGGSIFRRKTFMDSYEKFLKFIEPHFDYLQSIYPTIGWTDCMMSLLFLFAGKHHTINSSLHELNPLGGEDYDGLEVSLRDRYSILHHFKKNY